LTSWATARDADQGKGADKAAAVAADVFKNSRRVVMGGGLLNEKYKPKRRVLDDALQPCGMWSTRAQNQAILMEAQYHDPQGFA